jgi:hypothetical protein
MRNRSNDGGAVLFRRPPGRKIVFYERGIPMGKMRILAAIVTAVLVHAIPLPDVFPGASSLTRAANAQDDWRAEFDTLCAKTQDPTTLPVDELRQLVDRCDKLRPRIEKLDETQRKVYLRRLQMCRDLFAFVLQSKESK